MRILFFHLLAVSFTGCQKTRNFNRSTVIRKHNKETYELGQIYQLNLEMAFFGNNFETKLMDIYTHPEKIIYRQWTETFTEYFSLLEKSKKQ